MIRFSENVSTRRSNHGPVIITTSNMVNRRGRKLSVCSLICVAAWKVLTTSPTRRLGNIVTATSVTTNHIASRHSSTAMSGVMTDPHVPKLAASVPITIAQPSTSTNNMTLNGRLMMIGDSIIMPMAMSTLATTRSMTRNGMKSMNPI